jgi:hypothetical protein
MLPDNPDFPNIVMSFDYRGFTLELDQNEDNGTTIYSVWANHPGGFSVAVPGVVSRSEAIYKAKQWVDKRLQQPPPGNRKLRLVP